MFSCPAWRRWRTGFTRAGVLLGEYDKGEGQRSANNDRPQNPNWIRKEAKGVVGRKDGE